MDHIGEKVVAMSEGKFIRNTKAPGAERRKDALINYSNDPEFGELSFDVSNITPRKSSSELKASGERTATHSAIKQLIGSDADVDSSLPSNNLTYHTHGTSFGDNESNIQFKGSAGKNRVNTPKDKGRLSIEDLATGYEETKHGSSDASKSLNPFDVYDEDSKPADQPMTPDKSSKPLRGRSMSEGDKSSLATMNLSKRSNRKGAERRQSRGPSLAKRGGLDSSAESKEEEPPLTGRAEIELTESKDAEGFSNCTPAEEDPRSFALDTKEDKKQETQDDENEMYDGHMESKTDRDRFNQAARRQAQFGPGASEDPMRGGAFDDRDNDDANWAGQVSGPPAKQDRVYQMCQPDMCREFFWSQDYLALLELMDFDIKTGVMVPNKFGQKECGNPQEAYKKSQRILRLYGRTLKVKALFFDPQKMKNIHPLLLCREYLELHHAVQVVLPRYQKQAKGKYQSPDGLEQGLTALVDSTTDEGGAGGGGNKRTREPTEGFAQGRGLGKHAMKFGSTRQNKRAKRTVTMSFDQNIR
jgi:hypothetical protein